MDSNQEIEKWIKKSKMLTYALLVLCLVMCYGTYEYSENIKDYNTIVDRCNYKINVIKANCPFYNTPQIKNWPLITINNETTNQPA